MAVLKPRNRIVYFRVSEEEFQDLRSYCETYGARSVSDLARSAVLGVVQGQQPASETELLARLREIDHNIHRLNRKFDAFSEARAGHRVASPAEPLSTPALTSDKIPENVWG